MRLIDRARQENITDDDLENEIENWHKSIGTEELEDYLGIPIELHAAYGLGKISFAELIEKAIVLDDSKKDTR